jgi:hypothetical protein
VDWLVKQGVILGGIPFQNWMLLALSHHPDRNHPGVVSRTIRLPVSFALSLLSSVILGNKYAFCILCPAPALPTWGQAMDRDALWFASSLAWTFILLGATICVLFA